MAPHSNLHLNLKKCVLLRSPTSQNTVHFTNGAQSSSTPNILASHSAATAPHTHKGNITRLAKARKHFHALHQFWRHRLHTEVEASHIQCGRHSTRHIWAGDGWGVQLSQWEITTDWRPSIPKACGRTLHLKRTYYTQVLEPTGRTCTNQEVRALTSQPPLAHHKAQLKLFGHILLRSHPHSIKRNCCFTKFFQYRGGAVGAGLRPGRRRVRLTEQSIKLLWHWL